MVERDMSQLPSIKDPQIEPNKHAYLVLQNHGPEMGGWGPVLTEIPGVGIEGPVLYTGTDDFTIAGIAEIASALFQATGKPTRLVKYTEMEEVMSWE